MLRNRHGRTLLDYYEQRMRARSAALCAAQEVWSAEIRLWKCTAAISAGVAIAVLCYALCAC